MRERVYTTCRDLAAKLQDAGVPVEQKRDERSGRLQWWYPTWAGRAQGLMRSAGVAKTKRRVVLAALAHNADRRAALFALADGGDAERVRLYLESLAG